MDLTKLIKLESIIKDFVKYSFKIIDDKINNNEGTDIHHEIELSYTFPDLRLLSNLNLNNHIVNNQCYIECIRKPINTSNPIKYRNRMKFNYSNFELTNEFLYAKSDTRWEYKETLDQEIIHEYNKKKFIMKYAIEKPYVIELKNIHKDKTKIVFVISSKIIIDNIKIEFKIKHDLSTACSTRILSTFYNSIDTVYKYTEYSIEWEIIDWTIYKYKKNDELDLEIKKQKLYDNLLKAFSISFMNNNISKLYITLEIFKFKNIFTKFKSFENYNELIVEDYILTKKYNGRKVVFFVTNTLCYINIYDMVYLYPCNIFKNNILYGEGEFLKKDTDMLIYPYYFESINNTKYSRLDSIDLYNKLIDYKNTSAIIKFKQKDYIGPFDSETILLNNIIKYESFINDPDTDGLIILAINNTYDYVDYKFKLDNTIDIIFKLELARSSIYSTKNGLMIKLIGYVHDGNKFIEFNKVEVYYNDNTIKFNNDLLLLEYLDPFTNTITYIPNIFIGEYSMITKKIIPRLEKTNNFYRYFYKGNGINVVNNSRTFHEKFSIFDLDVLKNYVNNVKDNNNLQKSNHEDRLLNKKKLTYFQKNNSKKKKTGLNIITNIAKTQAISIAGSKITNRFKSLSSVLVIDIGQGGDLHKYYYIGIKNMVGTDPDPNGITETNNRYNKLLNERKIKSSVYMLKTYTISILNEKYESEVNRKFDLIDWQFAIHYVYCEKYKDFILKRLRNLINPKGKIIISCLDGDKIEQEFIRTNTNKLKYEIDTNIFYIIEKKNNDIITIYYDVSLENGKDEFLIRNSIIKDFKKYKFELIDRLYFTDLISEDHIILYKILSDFPRKSTSHFYKNIISKLNLLQNKNLLKLISFFNVMIFQNELN